MADDGPARPWVEFNAQTLALAPEQDPAIIAALFAEANREMDQLVRDLTLNGLRVDLQTNTNANAENPLGTSMQHLLIVYIPCHGSRMVRMPHYGWILPRKKTMQLITNGAICGSMPFFLQSTGAGQGREFIRYTSKRVRDHRELAVDLRNQLFAFSKAYQMVRRILNDLPNTTVQYDEFPNDTFQLKFFTPITYHYGKNFAHIRIIPDNDNQAAYFTSDEGLRINIYTYNPGTVHGTDTLCTGRDEFIHNLDTIITNKSAELNIAAIIIAETTDPTPPAQTQLPQLIERLVNLI